MVMRYAAHGLSDIGVRREQNEDSILMDPELGVFIVADGMGGHLAGEVASSEAARHVREFIAGHADVIKRLASDGSQANRIAAQTLVERAVQSACAKVYEMSRADRSKRGMGSTLDCLVVAGDCAIVGHVGDSRVYLLRHGRARRLTEDHTLVAEQIKAGVITKEQAADSHWRSVLTRAIGIQESVKVDTLLIECLADDLFLLCSDGLYAYVSDDGFSSILADGAPAELPRKLVDLANSCGGKDNVTALVVSVQGVAATADETMIDHTTLGADAESRMDVLRRVPLFQHLTYKEQHEVLAVTTSRDVSAATEIVRDGTPGEELFILLNGRCVVEKAGVAIGEVLPGGHFGEMSLVENAPRSATVRSLEPSRLMIISRSDMRNLMRREPQLAVKLLWSFVQVLSQRLRSASTEIAGAKNDQNASPPFVRDSED